MGPVLLAGLLAGKEEDVVAPSAPSRALQPDEHLEEERVLRVEGAPCP